MKKETIKGMSMEKYEQLFNAEWERLWETASHWNGERYDYILPPSISYPLYHCSAQVDIYPRTFVLRSYSTDVAVLDVENSTLLIRGRYSATTDQHVCKFMRWLREHHYEVRVVLQDYRKSSNEIGYNPYTGYTYKMYKSTGLWLTKRGEKVNPINEFPVYRW